MNRARGIPSLEPRSAVARPLWIAGFDALSVGAFAGAWAALLARLFEHAGSGAAIFALSLALLPAYWLADAISGLVHWFADSFFEEDAPLLGRLLIQPFREHHRDPLGITHHGFLEVCGNNCAACLLLLLPAWGLVPGPALAAFGPALALAALLVASFFVFATNGFHRWAHMPEPPGWVRALQRRRWILSPEQHALHHDAGHDRAYCVTSGWLNPLFDRTGVLRRLRRLAARRDD